MAITTVMFDLDGTLLPMDQEIFLKAYFAGLTAHMAPHGYESRRLAGSIWKGTEAMIKNDGRKTNETAFWDAFARIYGQQVRQDEPEFDQFYRTGFGEVRKVCGFSPKSREVIDLVRRKGLRCVLATNPIFPAIATRNRIGWAGLDPADFELYTTYENSSYCKPNPDYYREIFRKIGVEPEECLMVGNDVSEDMVAATLGCQVFLLTDCIINKNEEDIGKYPHGGFEELMEAIDRL